MGVRLQREKKKQLWHSVLYRFWNLPFLSVKTKQKIFLNLEWVFDRLAHEYSFKIYDEENHPVRLHTRKYLQKLINKSHSVLDLGSDEGVMSNYLADFAERVVGVDYDAEAIAIADKNYNKPNLKFIVADALDYLADENNKFDVLVLSHILEHIEEPEAFLKQFVPHFKYVYVEVPDFEKHYLNYYRKDLGLSLVYSDIDHVSEFDRDELAQILEDSNLKIIQSEFRHGVQRFWCEV